VIFLTNHLLYYCGKVRLCLSGIVASMAHYSSPRWYTIMEQQWNNIDRRKLKNSEKNLSYCHSVHQFYWTDQGANPGHYSEKPVTNCLRCGTAWWIIYMIFHQEGWIKPNIILFSTHLTDNVLIISIYLHFKMFYVYFHLKLNLRITSETFLNPESMTKMW
jgi:hypothetical protein